MSTITFTISASDQARIVTAFAATFGYQTTVNGLPNPMSQAEFARQRIMQYTTDVVTSYERQQAEVALKASLPAQIVVT